MSELPVRLSLSTWSPRMTIRARLTLTYASVLTVSGALMLGIVYVFMKYVPTYAILPADVEGVPAPPLTSDSQQVPPVHLAPAAPIPSGTDTVSSLQLSSADGILNTLLIVSIVVLVVLALTGSIAGWVIAGRILRPLSEINSAANLAATGVLNHRIGMRGPRDEIHNLADTFDDMLQKLEGLFTAHRRFAANASHELRTPLATTQTVLEVALADPDTDLVGLRTVAERVYQTNRRNIETVDSLLTLAEIGARSPRQEGVDLATIVMDVTHDIRDEIESVGIHLAVDLKPAQAVGDPVLLHRAFANLLQNAVRHNTEGGSILIRTGYSAEGAHMSVTNTGAVVPEDTVASLIEPFYRGTGRTTGQRHHGLGLAIVASVADVHDADLEIVANHDGGLTVTFTLLARDIKKS